MHPPDAPRAGAGQLAGMLEDMLDRRYLVVDGQGRISRWSPGAERVLGWREEEVVGRSAFVQPLAWTGDALEAWKSYFRAPQAARPPTNGRITLLCYGGAGLEVEMTGVPVPLVLGFEFTMLVGDLAVGGPGSQSEESLAQAHPLALDAIAAALSDDAEPTDTMAGLLLTFRAVGEPVDLGDPGALHAARALAHDRDDEREKEPEAAAEAEAEAEPELDEAAARRLAAAHGSLRAATEEVAKLRDEVSELRARLDEEERRTQEATALKESLAVELHAARDRLEEITRAREETEAELAATREKSEAQLAAAAAERDAAVEAKTAELDKAASELTQARADLEEAVTRHQQIAKRFEQAAAEQEAARTALRELEAERQRLQAALDAAAAERDELTARLEQASLALDEAARERESLGVAAGNTEQERELLRAELEASARRCEELTAALETKTSELQALPGAEAVEAAKRDRDDARAKLAEALAERDRAEAALQAAAGERDHADTALKQAETERDEARRRLVEAASESEEAHAAVTGHEERAEELRQRLEQAEREAAERAAEAEAARREAAEQRERVEAGFLATEAVAAERARVAELERQIEELKLELEHALASAAMREPSALERQAERWGSRRNGSETSAPRPPRSGLDDVETPRAFIGLDGRFTALNNGFCDLVGYSEAEFTLAEWPPVVDAERRDSLRGMTARILAGHLLFAEVDTVYMASSGDLIPVVGTLRLERDESGAAHHLVLDAQPRSAVTALG